MKVRCSGYDYEKKINLFEKKIQLIPLTFLVALPTFITLLTTKKSIGLLIFTHLRRK